MVGQGLGANELGKLLNRCDTQSVGVRNAQAQPNAIGNLQVSFLTSVLNGANRIASPTFLLELRRQGRVEKDEATISQLSRNGLLGQRLILFLHLVGQRVLGRLQRNSSIRAVHTHHTGCRVLMPSTRLRTANSELDELAQTRASNARIHTQLVHQAQAMLVSVLSRTELNSLHIQLVFQQLAVRLNFVDVLGDHGQASQRLANANLRRLAQRKRSGDDIANSAHRFDELRVIHQKLAQRGVGAIRVGRILTRWCVERLGDVWPAGQMHGLATSQAAPDLLCFHWKQWGDGASECLENRIQNIEGVRILIPEALAAVTNIPVRQRVDEGQSLVTRIGNSERVEVLLHGQNRAAQTGEQVTVHLRQAGHLVGGNRFGNIALAVIGCVGVDGEEVVARPQWQQHLANRILDGLLGHNKIATAQNRRAHQEPAHGVRTVRVEHAVDVRIVVKMLTHLLAIIAQHNAVAHHILEGRLAK